MSTGPPAPDDILRWPVRDDVRRLDLMVYEQAMAAAARTLGAAPGVVAVYQLGSVKFPGISDLDVIVVVDDALPLQTDFQAIVRQAAGREGPYVFSHAPYVVDRAAFERLPSLFFADNLQHRAGQSLVLAEVNGDEQAFCAFQIAVEAAIGQTFAFVRALHNRSLPNLRSLLCNLNAVRHNFTTLAALGSGPPPPHWAAYGARIDRLRGAWFELDPRERLAEACALVVVARALLLEILEHLGRLAGNSGWVTAGDGTSTLSLLDIGVLLRFGPGAAASDRALVNPLARLRGVPALGRWLALAPRWRELAANVSLLQLPATLYPLVDAWSGASGPVTDVMATRRLEQHGSASVLAGAATRWASERARLVNAHFAFLAGRQVKGFLPLTPASWLQRPATRANRLKTSWHGTWTRRLV